MKLRTKELAFSFAVIACAGAVILGLSVRSVRRGIVREVFSSQLARVGEVVARLPEGVRRRDERWLLPALQAVQARSGALYAAVLDRDGKVLAHTNVVEVGKVQSDAVTRVALAAEEPGNSETRLAGEPVLDVSIPVREAEEEFLLGGGAASRRARLGTLRFGVPLREPLATVRVIGFQILWIIVAVAVVASAAVVAFIHQVLAPVRLLAVATRRIAEGDLGVTVPARSRDELGSLARGFNRMSEALREASAHSQELREQLVKASRMEAMGHVAAKVAHDFNNMLTIIMGYGRMVEKHLPEGHVARAEVQQILKAGDRATAISKNLTAFSRGQILQPVVLDLNAWLDDTEPMLRRLAGDGVALALQLGADTPWVKADPGQLTQVATNLVANARDAQTGGGTIALRTANVVLDAEFVRRHPLAHRGAYVELAVADTGHGMDEGTLARMFEPFFTTKPAGRGTGLGLASVHGIVHQSGGYVWAESALGRGTTFHICLPREERGAAAVRPLDAASATPPVDGVTVLLVDDEDGVRGVAESALRDGGFAVVAAVNGVEALAAARAHPGVIHVLLTDAVMPQVSGFELARRLTAERPGIRVVVMTGFTNETAVPSEAASLGHEFLAKPFTDDELLRKVRGALDAR